MKTQTKHTPGPWYANKNPALRNQVLWQDKLIAVTVAHHDTPGQIEPNTHLIAAAPDLLAELEKQIAWLEHIKPQVSASESVMLGFDQSLKYGRALIARAKGEV